MWVPRGKANLINNIPTNSSINNYYSNNNTNMKNEITE